MKAIIVAFTLKGQDFKIIEQHLIGLGNTINDKGSEVVCIHGFMPRKQVEAKGWSTDVCNALDYTFPVQLNMYHGGIPLRKEMAEIGKALNATVYVIGEIKEGVFEEIELYKKLGLEIKYLPL